jgi:hypothetical protein
MLISIDPAIIPWDYLIVFYATKINYARVIYLLHDLGNYGLYCMST